VQQHEEEAIDDAEDDPIARQAAGCLQQVATEEDLLGCGLDRDQEYIHENGR
jgi:hypothetical protein